MMETNIQQSNVVTAKLKSQLHIRENSKDELEALFDLSKRQSTKPLSQRNLPDSFFKPPEIGTKTPIHSRQGSVDSTLLNNNSTNSNSTSYSISNALNQQLTKKLLSNHQNNHLRSNSEPVIMGQFSLASQQHQQQNQDIDNNNSYFHQRQMSMCTEAPLPQGWEMIKAPNGQRYFINHLNKETSWQDPRTFTYHDNNIENLLKLLPMPQGWEKSQTANGEIYFIDHNTQTTSWDDPRLPMIPNLIKQMQQQELQTQRQQQNTPLSSPASSTSSASLSLPPTPQQQQQQQPQIQITPQNPSPQFINNNNNNLKVQQQQQQQQQQLGQNEQTFTNQTNPIQVLNQINNNKQLNLNSNDKQQLKLLLIETIKKRQELIQQLHEINKQEIYLKSQLNDNNNNNDQNQYDYFSSSSSASVSPLSTTQTQLLPQQQQQQSTSININQINKTQQQIPVQNPLITQTQQQHLRQNSADSGVGGMNYTTQIFNNHETEIDSVNDLSKLNLNQNHIHMMQQIHFNQTNLNDLMDSDVVENILFKEEEIDLICPTTQNGTMTWI